MESTDDVELELVVEEVAVVGSIDDVELELDVEDVVVVLIVKRTSEKATLPVLSTA